MAVRVAVLFPSGLVPQTGGELNVLRIARQLQSDGCEVFGVCRPGPLAEALRAQGIVAEIFPPFAPLPEARSAYLLLAAKFFLALKQGAVPELDALDALDYAPQPFEAKQVYAHPYDEPNFATPLMPLLPPPVLTCARDALRVRRALAERAIDLCIADVPWDALTATAALPAAQVLWYVQGNSRDPLADDFVRKHGARIVACGEGVKADRFGGAPQIEVVANGVDSARFKPRDGARAAYFAEAGNALLLGCAGAIGPGKNQRALVTAMGQLLERGLDLHLYLFGTGSRDYRQALEAEAAPFIARVHFAGQVDKLEELLPSLDIFALPSRGEGLPLALCEAMASGVASIATDLPGCREVAGTDAACLVPRGDQMALVEAIATLAGSPTQRAALAKRGRQRIVEHFDQGKMLRRFSEMVRM